MARKRDGHRIPPPPRPKADWRTWLVVGCCLAAATGYFFWSRSRAGIAGEGTVALCAPEDAAATGLLVLDAFAPTSSPSSSQRRRRALIPLDARTGRAGPRIDAGDRAECLGGLGPNVLVATQLDGLHVRDPSTGALVTTEAQLLGASAGHVAKWEYAAAAHRLTIHTASGDPVVIDALARTPVPAAASDAAPTLEATAATPPSAHALAPLPTFSQHTAFYGPPGGPVLDTVGTYGLACTGPTCRLGTREIDGYGNGGEVTPLPGADELRGPRGQLAVPGRGVLVTRLPTSAESSRELAFVGQDGKVQWSLPGLPDGPFEGVLPDATHLLLTRVAIDDSRGRQDASAYLLDLAGHVVWTVHLPARDTAPWDPQATAASARYGDAVLVGAQGLVVAMPLGPGAERWRYEP